MKKSEQKWIDLFGSEWERIKRHGQAIKDPDEKQVFWDTILEMKTKNPAWSFESIQPTKKTNTDKAREECLSFVRGLRRAKVEGEESA